MRRFYCILALVTLGSFPLITANAASATDAIDTVTITIPVSCTMSNIVDAAHSGTIVNGTYKADIGTTTFKTICNDDNGYSIYAIGYSDDTYGNTEMISSNSTNPSS
ncbi:hypothetical protein IKF57_01145, partial [Candidatus Saccharibacteria bacterium]|nr:hypothetical protein [Candidatus Saccharibacteria bacterium]